MGFKSSLSCYHCVLVLCSCFIVIIIEWASPSSCLISTDGVFESRRALLAKTSCPIDFENQNYTIITSVCRGPDYTAKVCCQAFKKFACPFIDTISNETYNCADSMFSYINIYGRYPPGLFANECNEGKSGLDCAGAFDEAAASSASNSTPPIVAAYLFIILLLHMLL